MGINKQEDDLFKCWNDECHYDKFIKDGVINEEGWENAYIKICYVLKDANELSCNVNVDNDLRKFLREGGSSTYWKTWNNIVRYTKALLDEDDQYPRYISKACKTEYLSKVCAMNLKKIDGKSTANDKKIAEYVKQDAGFLRKQLNIYKPDIIICCGRGEGKNADLLHEHVLDKKSTSDWYLNEHSIKGISDGKSIDINYFYTEFKGKEKKTPVVSFFHPQKSGGSHLLFAEWYEIMRTIKRKLIV